MGTFPEPGSDAETETETETDADAELVQERRLAERIDAARESAVALEYVSAAAGGSRAARRVATGVVINDEGDLLSIRIDPPAATHAEPIWARNAQGRRYPARWLAADPDTGLTLLRIEPGAARPIAAARREPPLGSQVLVIGNPFGLGHSVLRGHVAGLGRRLELGPRPLGGLIQVAVALHPGDSGALLANLRGEWLGLIRSALARPPAEVPSSTNAPEPQPVPNDPYEPANANENENENDVGFAIPALDALWVADQLRETGRVDRAYLGVRIDFGARTEADASGAVLLAVLDNGPADGAGLRAGDRIVALNGHPIATPGDLIDRLDRTRAGTEATIDLIHADALEHRTLRTVSRPPPIPAPEPQRPAPSQPEPEPQSSSGTQGQPPLDLQPGPDGLLEQLERLEKRIESLEKQAKVP